MKKKPFLFFHLLIFLLAVKQEKCMSLQSEKSH